MMLAILNKQVWSDVERAVNCTKQKAGENGNLDSYVWAASPDWPGQSGGMQRGAELGVWKWAMLGVAIVCAAVA